MLKARGKVNGEDTFVFGLSWANLDRLRQGQPISFDGNPFGIPGRVYIFSGETEGTMAAEIMAENPDAAVRTDPEAQA